MDFVILLFCENLRKYTFLSALVYSFSPHKIRMFISEIVEVDNIWIHSLDIVNHN